MLEEISTSVDSTKTKEALNMFVVSETIRKYWTMYIMPLAVR